MCEITQRCDASPNWLMLSSRGANRVCRIFAFDLISIHIRICGRSKDAAAGSATQRIVKRRLLFPQAHIVEHLAVSREVDAGAFLAGIEFDLSCSLIEAEAVARGFDVALQVGSPSASSFGRTYSELTNGGRRMSIGSTTAHAIAHFADRA